MTGPDPRYVGRFAPSPSGDLHFGSVVTAVAGHLRARAAGGEWLLRIDDVDPPRTLAGAAAGIERTLQRLGLQWDRPVFTQRHRLARYRSACQQLLAQGDAFYCTCSRRDLGGRAYPGTCRGRTDRPHSRHCVRVRVDGATVTLDDRLQGTSHWNLETAGGDFVIWRVEDLPAYHLAAVIDDADCGVTEVVRGADLLDSAPRQRWLQRLLQLPSPDYLHIPAAVDARGQKLSKQNHAPAIDGFAADHVLLAALSWLNYRVPVALQRAAAGPLLAWAARSLDLTQWPRGLTRPAPVLAATI